MENIIITRNGKVLAHQASDRPLSRTGQKAWLIDQYYVRHGKIEWRQGEKKIELKVRAHLGDWVIVRDRDGLNIAIRWRQGTTYFADFLINRKTGQPVKRFSSASFMAGRYKVRSVVGEIRGQLVIRTAYGFQGDMIGPL